MLKKSIISLLALTLTLNIVATTSAASVLLAQGVLPGQSSNIISSAPEEIFVSYDGAGKYSISNNISKTSTLRATKEETSDSLYKLDNSDIYLLSVNGNIFTEVGKEQLDLNNVNDFEKLNTLNINSETLQSILDYVCFAEANNIDLPVISVYSPTLLETQLRADNYYYYQGPGGYTYKDEIVFYNNVYSGSDIRKTNDKTAFTNLLYETTKYVFEYGIGNTQFAVPYSLYGFFSNLLDKPVQSYYGTETITYFKETSKEVRYCYIRQNLGNGMLDYYKAASSKSTIDCINIVKMQGYQEVTKTTSSKYYKGSNFDLLCYKAYDYRASSSIFDERVRYVKDSQSGKIFYLYY